MRLITVNALIHYGKYYDCKAQKEKTEVLAWNFFDESGKKVSKNGRDN